MKEKLRRLPQQMQEKYLTKSNTFSGEGNGNPLQYSCQENPMDRGAWWATSYRVTKSQTQLK